MSCPNWRRCSKTEGHSNPVPQGKEILDWVSKLTSHISGFERVNEASQLEDW